MKALRVCLFLCAALHAVPGTPEDVSEAHGTVNVILANRNGLVAVVDSMLTGTDSQGRTSQEATGEKLFKVDDQTICTMAGFYSYSGALNMSEYAVKFPVIMSHYVQTEGKESRLRRLSFAAKVELLERLFQTELRNNLTAHLAFSPTFRVAGLQPIFLTLAGYDLDGILKIAEFELKPARSVDGVSLEVQPVMPDEKGPACEATGKLDASPTRFEGVSSLAQFEVLPPSRIIGAPLFCEVAGIITVATRLLAHPDLSPQIKSLQGYAQSEKARRSLSLAEMRALALDLEKETEIDETAKGTHYVGGEPHIAVLEHGRVTEAPPSLASVSSIGIGLRQTPFEGVRLKCMNTKAQGIAVDTNRSLFQVQAYVTECAQQLDGILFHDSSFTNSVLKYDGSGPLLFAHSNSVVGSTLTLGTSVRLDDPLVKDLMCYYSWKRIEQSQKPVVPRCM